MTDDFKKNILDYVTNNVTTTSPEERYSFLETQTLSSDWAGDILPSNYNELKYGGVLTLNGTDLAVIYGYYYDTSANEYRGIITLLDSEMKPIKSFFKYDSGTYLQPILNLEQSDDNTFYGVDATFLTLKNRFIMLNNFTIKNANGEYQLTLKKAYNFASNYVIAVCFKMYKSSSSAHYVIFGQRNQTIKVIELKINVGESNEWDLKSYAAPIFSDTYEHSGKPIALFDENDNVFWRFLVLHHSSSTGVIKCFTKNYNSSTATITTLTNENIYELYDYSFKDINTVYFGVNVNDIDETLYSYNFTNQKLNYVYGWSLEYEYEGIKIDICNSEVYVVFHTYAFDSYNISITRLENGNFTEFFETIYFGLNRYKCEWFFAKQNYNLVSVYALKGNESSTIDIPQTGYLFKDNYNPLNYNGYEYTGYNSMIPVQGTLYSNNSLVFARNLYDKTINNNITTSTIVVPNLYLNDINIDTQNLLSETNSVMIDNENTITKNVYETGYFNFINTLNVIDNNNNSTLLNSTANYINENINVGTQENCNNSFIGKIRVTYEDNTTNNIGIVWNKASDKVAYTEFALTLTQPILQIDLTSNDSTTTYLTITPDNLEAGKTYKFTQYLKIE